MDEAICALGFEDCTEEGTLILQSDMCDLGQNPIPSHTPACVHCQAVQERLESVGHGAWAHVSLKGSCPSEPFRKTSQSALWGPIAKSTEQEGGNNLGFL